MGGIFGWLFKGDKPAMRVRSGAPVEVADRLIARGRRAESNGNPRKACEYYREAVKAAPDYANAHLNLGIGMEAAGDTAGAVESYRAALAIEPENPYANFNLGNLSCARGLLPEAEHHLRLALDRKPDFAEANVALSNVYDAQGNSAAALTALEVAIRQQPDYAGALYNYAMILARLKRYAEAEAALRRAVASNPGNIGALQLLGDVLRAQGRKDEAVASYRKAIALEPAQVDAHIGLGISFREQGRFDQAAACCEKALSLAPNAPLAHCELGNVFVAQGRLNDAVACYRKALEYKPDFPRALSNLGNVLRDQGQVDEAIACFRRALALDPDFAEAHSGLGNAFSGSGRLDEAIECFEKALVLEPDFAEAYLNLGNALRDQAQFDRSLESYARALRVDAEYVEARWARAMSQIPVVYASAEEPARCREAFSRELDELERWFDAGRSARGARAVGVQQPFYLAYQEEDNRALLERYGSLCVRLMDQWFKGEGFAAVTARGRRGAGEPIRVGVVSQHFRNHSVWKALMRGWFEQLDPQRFALHAFYLGSVEDQETRFAKSRARHFEQGARGLRQWIEAIGQAQPDVLIYPEIGMDPLTLKLASLRLAPVQAASWGHPQTTGLPTIDYYLSAEDLEPPGAQRHYSERLVSLPHLGCFYRPWQDAPVEIDPGVLGIRAGVPLLVCPGMPFKYAPQFDWILAQIARRLGRCELVFFNHQAHGLSDRLRRRLQIAFDRQGLRFDEFARFIPWQSGPMFDALMRRADVCLDTIGFSGFNTAMQALECDLPIVAREGRFLRGRLASGILRRMGLQELVAAGEEEYVALAVKLCRDTEYREHVRGCISAARPVLYADAAPIRALEEILAGAVT